MRDKVIDWYIHILLFILVALLTNIEIISNMFIYIHTSVKFIDSRSYPASYFLMSVGGLYIIVVFLIRKTNICVEIALLFAIFFFGNIVSQVRSPYLDYKLGDENLRREFYGMIKEVIRYGQCLCVLIWHGTRFLKKSPVDIGRKLVVGLTVSIWIGPIIYTIVS